MGNEKIRSRFFNNPLSSVSHVRSNKLALFAAALVVSPMYGSTVPQMTEENDTWVTEQTGGDHATCGTTEIQRPVPREELALLGRMYRGEATILDSPSVAGNPQFADIGVVTTLVQGEPRETRRAHAELVLATARRLADRSLAPTAENVQIVESEIEAGRERYRFMPIFHGTVIFASGAVTSGHSTGQSVYMPEQVTERLQRLRSVGSVLSFNGLLRQRQDCRWSTVESLEGARDATLRAIESTNTPITVLFRMHGNQNLLEFGALYPTENDPQTRAVILRARELARSYARRYSNHTIAHMDRPWPDMFIFDDCQVYDLAMRTFRDELAAIERAERISVPRPAVIIAGEDDQFAFRGELMRRILPRGNSPRKLENLYPDGDRLGHGANSSNAVVLVPDGRGGMIQIA